MPIAKTITICGSMTFLKEMLELKSNLEALDILTYLPKTTEVNIDHLMAEEEKIDLKNKFINDHIEKIKLSDAILIANFTKKGQDNYIGASAFLELGFAYLLNKKIFILNDIPYSQSNCAEILGLKPIPVLGDLTKIVNFL